MAEITLRRRGELLRGVFGVLFDEPDGLPAKIVLQRAKERVPPTNYESGVYPSSPRDQRFDKIVRFATIQAVKAGWLVKDKGTWALTDEGREAYERIRDPERFAATLRDLYREWKSGQPEDESGDDDEPAAAATLEEAEEAAWADIEKHLLDMNPYDLQNLVAGLLRAMGYHVAWVAPPGKDKGIDILATSDPLGVTGPRIKVQVKRHQDRIPVDAIRSFIAVLGEADVGVFVATGGFTRDAEDEVRGQERRKLMLLDLKRLFDLWVEHYERVPEVARALLPLRTVHYLAPTE